MPNDKTNSRDKVLIANGQGFWGDSILGPIRLVNEGPLDYLTLDYLAEVTMSIMQKLKSRDPSKGYATDFVEMCRRVLPTCREKGIKIIANAGGVNPVACRTALADVIRELGLTGMKIGIVEGDDILGDLDVTYRRRRRIQEHGQRSAVETVSAAGQDRQCLHRCGADRRSIATRCGHRYHRPSHGSIHRIWRR